MTGPRPGSENCGRRLSLYRLRHRPEYLFPALGQGRKKEDFLGRLRNPELQSRLREAVSEAEKNVGTWDKVLISSVRTDKNRWLEGLNLEQASRLRGQDIFTFIRDLLLDEEGQVSMVCFAMSEDNLKKFSSIR